MYRINVWALLVFACSIASMPAFAGGGATGGATEITQLLNYGELLGQTQNGVYQLQQEIQMYSTMARNITNLPNMTWGNITGDMMQLRNVISQGNQISYALQNVDTEFRSKFPGYNPPTNYSAAYQSWSQASMDGVRSALNAAGIQNSQFDTENGTMAQLESMTQSAVGQQQVLQAGNEIAAQQVQQLQKLRQLEMSQMQAQDNYIASQQSTQDAARATGENAFMPAAPQPAHPFQYQLLSPGH